MMNDDPPLGCPLGWALGVVLALVGIMTSSLGSYRGLVCLVAAKRSVVLGGVR
jgi:hypothetical protein